MNKTKLLIFYLLLFSLLLVPQAFAVNEVCGDGTNNCCSTGPNCLAGEYWNGLSCSPYTACAPGESFFCGTGTCSANYCSASTPDSGIENVCCPDGQVLVADSGSATGWSCSAPGGSGSWPVSGSDIYYDAGNVGIGTSDIDHTLEVNGGICVGNDAQCTDAVTSATGDIVWWGELKPRGVTCADGQIVKRQAGRWVCAADDTSGAWVQDGNHLYYDITTIVVGSAPSPATAFYSYLQNSNSSPNRAISAFNQNSYSSTPATDIYGTYSHGFAAGVNNTNTAYGIYGYAQNSSTAGCISGDCARSYGGFFLAEGEDSRGAYGEGEYIGVQAVVPSTSTSSGALALWVDQNKNNETAARFECAGTACLSAEFLNGSDASPTISRSGYAIIGNPTGPHLALDTNEIMAKANGTSGTSLFINYQSGNTIIGDYGIYVSETANRVSIMKGFLAPSYTLDVNGTVAGVGAYVNSSDERWKKNIEPIKTALDKILSLNGKTFEFKKEEFPEKGFEDGRQYGFIAQEAEKILPEVVSTDNEGYKNLAYSEIVPILVEAMKEQQEQILQLKAMICSERPEAEQCQ